MLNHVSIMGRFVTEPNLRHTPNNDPVLSFSLAVDKDYRDKEGNRGVDFLDFVAWKAKAEYISKYYHKGDLVVVSGRLLPKHWTDKEGHRRRNVEIIIEDIYFASGSKRSTNDTGTLDNTTVAAAVNDAGSVAETA